MSDKIYSYGKQIIEDDDIAVVVETLKGDWLTQGPSVSKFEEVLSKQLGTKYCTVTANGTASLHLMAIGLGWQPNEVIITSPITFLASANCAMYVNSIPDFADINPITYTIDPLEVEKRLHFHKKKNRKVRAIVGVDFAGHPCDWSALKEIADLNNLQLINDHCHAIGSVYNGDSHFASKYADAVNLSFHPVKHLTSGEGGAIVTRHEWLDKKVKILRTHGMTKDPALLSRYDGLWYYEMVELGFNYRITDFQCALGVSQLAKLNRFLDARKKIAMYYDKAFSSDHRFVIPEVQQGCTHAYHIYALRIKFSELKISKKIFFERLRSKRIFCQVHYIPVHLQPYYRTHFGFNEGDYPIAEQFYSEEVSIPCYPGLSETDLEYIVETIRAEAV